MNNKTLLIGWDAADWKVINPLIEQGKMPNLESLIQGGASGNLATLQPVLSPTLWTSIATGKRPYKHGIHGFTEPDPVVGGIRPVTNLSRSTKAIWNILNQEKKDTITVGWWPSNPAEPLSRGIMVSNDYQKAHGDTYEPDKWPMKKGTVHPEELSTKLKELRFHPAELNQDDLLAFMPCLKELTQEELDKVAVDPRMQSLMKIIAECTSIHSAMTALLTNKPWDLACVYYDAIDHFGHAFMQYHPPQREGVSDWDFKLFNYITEAGYRYHDMMLGTLIDTARAIDPETNIVLISDHGFHPDDLRLHSVPNEPAGPAAEHRQYGIIVANGPEIKKGGKVYGASLIDICPTLLHLFGLPVGEDMDGKVLLDIYTNPPKGIERIPSWDEIDGDHGMHPPNKQIAPEDSKAAIEQLAALGYIDEPSENESEALEETVRELNFNLAQAWIDGGIYTEAIAILEELYEKWPLEHRFGYQLAICYRSLGRTRELRKIISLVIKRRLKDASSAIEEIKELNLHDEKVKDAEREKVAKMTEQESKKFHRERRNLVARAKPNLFNLRYLDAIADFSEKKYDEALAKLQDLNSDFGSRIKILSLRGEVLSKLRRWDEARVAYEQALKIDSELSGPLLGLARVEMAQRNFSDAIVYATNSVNLLFFQPKAHYILGLAYYRLKQFDHAEHALLISVKQAPLLAASWRVLGDIAKLYQSDVNKSFFYKQKLREARQQLKALKKDQTSNHSNKKAHEPFTEFEEIEFNNSAPCTEENVITIVSGLPRSGTSLMMQILEAAGVNVFTDGNRLPDESNKKGYYEHDKVMGLGKPGGKAWVQESQGSALKVVAPLLSSLPVQAPLKYRVIFMERDIEEILNSQNTMLERLGKETPKGDASRAYQQQISHAVKWINRNDIHAITVNYNQLVSNPEDTLITICRFLGLKNAVHKIKPTINPSLYRTKKQVALNKINA